MREIILLKAGEMILKGLNRASFENKAISNMQRRVRRFGEFKIYSAQSTFYVEPLSENTDMDAVFDTLSTVFGFTSISRALECEKDTDKITCAAIEYLGSELNSARTFKVESRRSDKTFPLNSIELSQTVGGNLHDKFPHLEVDVRCPEFLINIEVRENAAYVHARAQRGAGGLPVGINGRGAILLSGGIDSPVAAYMMARRGLQLDAVHFASPPYTSERARDKVMRLAKLLTPYTGRLTVHIVPFTEIQETIRKNCREDLFTLIMRRFMMRISERIAQDINAGCLITGESLGQVASQTMEALLVTGCVCSLPIFRPVIGMDKEEIIRCARKINTFETSIEPYEDCCTVFTPKHPKTKPKLYEITAAEAVLDIDTLISKTLLNIEREAYDL